MNDYYGDNHVESTTYTPHLLPMFQQTQTYHTLHDEDHLEDASVLLSLSYPGGLPAGENNPTVQGQRVVPDWEAGQTINMMMDTGGGDAERNRSNSATTTGASGNPTPGENTILGESIGNFLGAMNWLGGMKEGTTPSDANGWVSRDDHCLTTSLSCTRHSHQPMHRPSHCLHSHYPPSSHLRRSVWHYRTDRMGLIPSTMRRIRPSWRSLISWQCMMYRKLESTRIRRDRYCAWRTQILYIMRVLSLARVASSEPIP